MRSTRRASSGWAEPRQSSALAYIEGVNPMSRRSLLAAGLVLAAGCKTTRTFVGPDGTTATTVAPGGVLPQRTPIESVAMVGDSITAASESSLRDALAAVDIDDVVIDGETSRRVAIGSGRNGQTLSGVRAVKKLLKQGTDPSVWVIALGTNDVGTFDTPQDCADLIGEITVLLPPPVRLEWVNVYRPSDVRQTKVFNQVLAAQLEVRGDAVVADWYSVASDPNRDVLRDDNVHPNDAGTVAFAELVVQALQRL